MFLFYCNYISIMYIIKEAILNEEYYNEMYTILERDKLPLKQWNDIQKQLWSQLVYHKLVDKNDAKMFFNFGKMFNDYYQKTGKIISYNMVVASIMGAI